MGPISGFILICIVLTVIVFGIFLGEAVQKIMYKKRYKENWFWVGFLFGILALIVALLLPPAESKERLPVEVEKQLIIRNGGWCCVRCGRINHHHVGTCACGKEKDKNSNNYQ